MAPIVARVFVPEHFGIAALFVAVVAMVEPISALCYDQAALLPKSDGEAQGLIKLSLYSVVMIACLLLAFIIVFTLTGPATELQEQLGLWVWCLPLAASLIGLNSVSENWRIRQNGYSNIARADIAQSLTTPLTRISMGLVYGSSVAALIGGYLTALVVRFALLWKGFPLRNVMRSPEHAFARLQKLAYEFREFPIYNAPARFVRAFSNSLPVLVLGLLFSPLAAGLYAMANRLVGAPSEIVAGAVRRVYLRHAAERYGNDLPLGRFLFKVTAAMFLLGLVPFSVLWLWGEEIVRIILGDNWSDAGLYAELLAPWFFVVWLSSPTAMLYVVMRQQRQWLVSQFVLAFVRTFALLWAYVTGANALESIAAYVAVSVTVNLVLVAGVFWFVRRDDVFRASRDVAAS